nr:hypothetical protein [Tanacetum cinerariifolium]
RPMRFKDLYSWDLDKTTWGGRARSQEKVEKNLITEEIDKLVKGMKNVENSEGFNCFLNNQEVPSTRLEPMSNKESPEVGKTDVVSQPMNVIEEEEESPEDDYELRRREKYKNVEETRHTPSPTTIRFPGTHSTLISLDTEKL